MISIISNHRFENRSRKIYSFSKSILYTVPNYREEKKKYKQRSFIFVSIFSPYHQNSSFESNRIVFSRRITKKKILLLPRNQLHAIFSLSLFSFLSFFLPTRTFSPIDKKIHGNACKTRAGTSKSSNRWKKKKEKKKKKTGLNRIEF